MNFMNLINCDGHRNIPFAPGGLDFHTHTRKPQRNEYTHCQAGQRILHTIWTIGLYILTV